MNNLFANRVKNLKASATLAMAQKARELISQGIDVINMSLGEPDFQTPDFVKSSAHEAIDNNFTYYFPVPGFLDLREAICEKLFRDNSLSFKPENIVVSTGAKQSLANIVFALVNEGDEVIIPAPYWVSYRDMVSFAGGKAITPLAGVEQDYKITPEQLKNSISEKTKVLMFSNPSNPTGSVYSENELKELGEVLAQYPHIIIVSDEIYEHIFFDDKPVSIASILKDQNPIVVVNGLSKGFAMTGWRLGYMAAPLELAKACSKIQSQFTSGASSISQKAAVAALKADPNEVSYMRETFRKRRDLLMAGLKEIKGLKLSKPEGAFYLFVDFSSWLNGKTCSDLSQDILEKAHIALTPGIAFGAPGYLRFSYAVSEERIVEAIDRLKSYQSTMS